MTRLRAVRSALICVTIGCSGDATDSDNLPRLDVTDEVVLLHEIGVGSGPASEIEFGYIGDVATTAEGQIYVLDAMAGAVLRFGPQGEYLNSVGQRGEGPGEFQNPFAMAVTDTNLVVWDRGLWRISTFAPDGTLLRTDPVDARPESGWIPRIAPASGGSWLYLDQEIASPDEEGAEVSAGVIRGTAELQRWIPAEEEWREVGRFPSMKAALIKSDGQLSLTDAPFPAAPVWAPAEGDSYWYADNKAYDIAKISYAGDTLVRITAAVQPPAVGDSAWNAYVGGESGDMSTPAARRRAGITRPAAMPLIERMLTSDGGDLWVEVHSDPVESVEWHVYTAEGKPRFRVHFPASVSVRAISDDRLVAVTRDALDVQHVAVYGLPESPPP